jgi:hypothetical protein
MTLFGLVWFGCGVLSVLIVLITSTSPLNRTVSIGDATIAFILVLLGLPGLVITLLNLPEKWSDKTLFRISLRK